MNESQSILVIDDDDAFRRRLVRAFSDRGLLATEAANSAEALSLAQRERPRRAVLDLKLAQESGLTLLPQLLLLDKELKVVVLTGYGTVSTAVSALKLGAINYLSKPTDADAVLAAFDQSGETSTDIDPPGLAQVEWDYIQRVVSDCEGNISKASKMLGLHRRSLQRKLIKSPQRIK